MLSPKCGAEWRLQFSCTSGMLGLLLRINNQLLASMGVVSQINPYSKLTENGDCYEKFQTTERGGFEPPVGF